MSITASDVPLQRTYILVFVNAMLAIGLTVLSFRYVQPEDCTSFCGEQTPCPTGSCRFGEQKAGWPFPAFVDYPGGGSPTSGWGHVGPEDPPIPAPMIADVLFYSILSWIVVAIIQFFSRQVVPLKLILLSLSLNAFLGVCLWVFYTIFTFTLGFDIIGYGH